MGRTRVLGIGTNRIALANCRCISEDYDQSTAAGGAVQPSGGRGNSGPLVGTTERPAIGAE